MPGRRTTRSTQRSLYETEVPRGWRCRLLRHPWRWSANELYLRIGLSFKVCTKAGCRV